MALQINERVSVLETQVLNLDEKIDEIKVDIKEIDVKIVSHTENVTAQLRLMAENSSTQHGELAKKIGDLEKFKTKWMYMIIGGVAVGAWMLGHFSVIDNLLK